MLKISDWNSRFLLVYMLVMISGNPVLFNPVVVKFSLPVLFLFVLFKFKMKIECGWERVSVLMGVFVVAFASHLMQWGVFTLSMISILMKVFVGATIVSYLKDSFPFVYLRVIFHICWVSLVFYSIQVLFGPESFPSLFDTFFWAETQRSVFFHNVVTLHPDRNCGPFWEPGAFQGFINLAFFLLPLNYFFTSRFAILKGFVLLLSLITTFSTTGYLVFFVILLYKLLSDTKNKYFAYLFFAFFVFVAIQSYSNFDFLGQKIEEQLELADTSKEFDPGRFSVLEYDLHYIYKSPLFGNGYADETRWADHLDFQGETLGHGNGFTGYLAEMGLLSFFAYIFLIIKSRFYIKKSEAVFFAFVIILLLQGEHFLDLPLYLGLPFMMRERVNKL